MKSFIIILLTSSLLDVASIFFFLEVSLITWTKKHHELEMEHPMNPWLEVGEWKLTRFSVVIPVVSLSNKWFFSKHTVGGNYKI